MLASLLCVSRSALHCPGPGIMWERIGKMSLRTIRQETLGQSSQLVQRTNEQNEGTISLD